MNPIYQFLLDNKLTQLSEEDFLQQYVTNTDKQTKLFSFLKQNNLTQLNQDEFVGKYLSMQTQELPTPTTTGIGEFDEGRSGFFEQPYEIAKKFFQHDLPEATTQSAGAMMQAAVNLSMSTDEAQNKLKEIQAKPKEELTEEEVKFLDNVYIGNTAIEAAKNTFSDFDYNPNSAVMSWSQVESPKDAVSMFVNNAARGGSQLVGALFTGGYSIPMEVVGDVYTETIEETAKNRGISKEEASRSNEVLLTTAAVSTLVSAVEKTGLDKMLGKNKASFFNDFRGAVKEVLKRGNFEGMTEVVQEAIQYMGIQIASDGNISMDEFITRAADAYTGGFATGGGVTTVTSLVPKAKPETEEVAEVQSKIDTEKDKVADTGDLGTNEVIDSQTRGIVSDLKKMKSEYETAKAKVEKEAVVEEEVKEEVKKQEDAIQEPTTEEVDVQKQAEPSKEVVEEVQIKPEPKKESKKEKEVKPEVKPKTEIKDETKKTSKEDEKSDKKQKEEVKAKKPAQKERVGDAIINLETGEVSTARGPKVGSKRGRPPMSTKEKATKAKIKAKEQAKAKVDKTKLKLTNQITNIVKPERSSRPSDQLTRLNKIIETYGNDSEYIEEVERAEKEAIKIQKRVDAKSAAATKKARTVEDRINDLKEKKDVNAGSLESAYSRVNSVIPDTIDNPKEALTIIDDAVDTIENLETTENLDTQADTKKVISEITRQVNKIKKNPEVKKLLDERKKEQRETKKSKLQVRSQVDKIATKASMKLDKGESIKDELKAINELRESLGSNPITESKLKELVKTEFIQKAKKKEVDALNKKKSKQITKIKTALAKGKETAKGFKKVTKEEKTKKPTQKDIEKEILDQLNALDREEGFTPDSDFYYKSKNKTKVAVPFKNIRKISLNQFTSVMRQTANTDAIADAMMELIDKVNTIRKTKNLPPVKFYVGESMEKGTAGLNVQSGNNSAIILATNFKSEAEHAPIHEFIHEYHGMLAQLAYGLDLDKALNSEIEEVFTNTQAYIAQVLGQIDIDSYIGNELTGKQKAIKALYQELTGKEVDFMASPEDVYGLSNLNEFIAEAFSNPVFIQLLNEVEGKGYEPNSKKSTIYKLYDALVNFIKTTLPEFYNNNKTAYTDLLATISNYEDKLFEDIDSIDVFDRDFAELSLAKMSDEQKYKKRIRKKLATATVVEGNTTKADIDRYISNTANEAGLDLTTKDIKLISNAALKLVQHKNNAKTLISDIRLKMNDNNKYNSDIFYRSFINDVLNINVDNVLVKDRKKLIDVLNNIITTGEYNSKDVNFISDLKKEEALTKLSKHKDKKIKTLADSKSKLLNPSQIATFIAKFDKEFSNDLFSSIYSGIMDANAFSQLEVQRRIFKGTKNKPSLFEISNTNKLTTKDHIKTYMYAMLQPSEGGTLSPEQWEAQLQKNIEDEFKALDAKLDAANKKSKNYSLTNKPVNEVKKEIEILKELQKDFSINEKQQELLDAFRSMLDDYSMAARINTEAVHNKTFDPLQYYIPKKALGKNKGNFVENDYGDNLVNILTGAVTDENSTAPAQSGYTKSRADIADGTYYEYDLLRIATNYASSVTFDVMATKEVKMLNKLLKSQRFKDIVGKENVKVIKNRLSGNIKAGVSKGRNYNKITKALEKIKNKYVVGMLGTSTQFLVQFMGTLPGMYLQNPKGFPKAVKYFASPEKFRQLEDFIEKNGMSIKVRDVLFEKFENIEDFDKGTIGRGASKYGRVVENTTTYLLRKSDKLAAKMTWLSAYFEAGGTLENPSKNAIVAAENATTLLQNVSDATFAPEIFNPKSNLQRLMVSAFLSFKSFALNQNLNSIEALANIDSPQARRLLAANVANSLAYQVISGLIVKSIYSGITSNLIDILPFLEGSDEEEEEKNYGIIEDLGVNTFVDVFFSGMGPAGEMINWAANEHIYPQIRTKASYNDNYELVKEFDKYKDSPLYSKKTLFESTLSSGPYGDFLLNSDKISKLSKQDDVETSDLVSSLLVPFVPFMPIPFKGDLARLSREWSKKLRIKEEKIKEFEKIRNKQ